MDKRAIEFQVHWIFILIAGAVILAFFFGIVQKQKTVSEQKLSIRLSQQMEAVFAGAIESKGTSQQLAIPQPGIAFSCTQACDCSWIIGKKANPFLDNLIFAPPLLQGTDALAWSLEWKLPFRVTNLLYLTNPDIQHVLVYDRSLPRSRALFERVTELLPKELAPITLDTPSALATFPPEGYAHTRIIFLDVQPFPNLGLSQEWEDQSVSGVAVLADNRAIFYDKIPGELNFNTYPSLWAEESLLFAAFFSADHALYSCGMRQAFGKLSTIARIQSARAAKLQDAMDRANRPECVYAQTQELLESVSSAAQEIAQSAQPIEEHQHLATIISAQPTLKAHNENLIRQYCPALY